MFYHYSITVPAGTLAAAPLKTIIPLSPGEIHQVEIGFPWGCAGLVHVQVYRAEHMMWPTNPGDSFAWNDYNVVFTEAENSFGETEEWSVRSWNLDSRHDHTIIVRIGIIPTSKTVFGKIAESLFGGPSART